MLLGLAVMLFTNVVAATAAMFGGFGLAQSLMLDERDTPMAQPVDNSSVYMNPILAGTSAADPWVVQDGDWYYMMYTMNTNITLLRSKSLTNWNGVESKLVYMPPDGTNYSTDLWAPEIHKMDDNRWYVIFTADPNTDNPPPQIDQFCTYTCPAVNHRMYVLQSSSSDIWTSSYQFAGELDTYDQFAIDGSYFKHKTGLYHVYSCWYSKYESWPANLCISKMANPITVTSNYTERAIISVPSEPWEKTPYGRSSNVRLSSNEAPQQLTNHETGQEFIIYSAARSDNPNYCLGQLELTGTDPMNPSDWTKHPGCVFYQNKLEKAYGVGHASFVKSPSGNEHWIVYHGMLDPWSGWSARSIRAQRFWFQTKEMGGAPIFPRPGYGPYPVPN